MPGKIANIPRKIADVAIVGAGPAGLAAAIYLARAGWNIMLIERSHVGGLLRNANAVENYPGLEKPLKGDLLADIMAKQVKSLGVRITKGDVSVMRRMKTCMRMGFALGISKETIRAQNVIIATGTRPVLYRLPGIETIKSRLFYEPADLLKKDIIDKRVVIIGGGDAAFDYALNLRAAGTDVAVVCRGRTKCLPLLKKRALELGVLLLENYTPLNIVKDRTWGGVFILQIKGTGNIVSLPGDYLLAACGREPVMPALDGIELKKKNAVDTGVPGLYLAGDLIRGTKRQVGIAVGDGILAAMLADERLRKIKAKGTGMVPISGCAERRYNICG